MHEDLSINDSIAPYYRRRSCKQFIWAKPIRFGYKPSKIASAIGLPYQVKI